MPRKAELVKAIADESGISKKDAAAAFNALVSYISETVKPGEAVSIPGLGRITVTPHHAREVRIPYAARRVRLGGKNGECTIKRSGKNIERTIKRSGDALKMFTDTYKKL